VPEERDVAEDVVVVFAGMSGLGDVLIEAGVPGDPAAGAVVQPDGPTGAGAGTGPAGALPEALDAPAGDVEGGEAFEDVVGAVGADGAAGDGEGADEVVDDPVELASRVEVDGVGDGHVRGPAAGGGLPVGVLGVLEAAVEPGEGPLGGGLPHEPDGEPFGPQGVSFADVEVLAGLMGQVPHGARVAAAAKVGRL